MNKWLIRILGVLVLVILGLIFFDAWFSPGVPPQLNHQSASPPVQPVTDNPATPTEVPTPDQAPISLTSLEDFESDAGNPAPALTNTPTPAAANPPTPATAPQSSAPAAESGNAWIQAGSFGELENAQRQQNILKNKGFNASIESAQVNGKTYHRIYLGPMSQTQANAALKQLSGAGIAARQITR